MNKRIVALLLAGCMVCGLTACGGNGKSDEKVSNEEGEKITLEFMNGSSEEQYVEWLDEVIANFEAENENIEVEVQKVSIDSYSQTVMTRFSSGDVPDLFSFAENDIADMVPSGYVMDLSDSANIENYEEGMLDSLSLDGKVYALPISNDFMCVTYNKAVFKEAGITEVPKTWSDFLKVCKQIKEKEIAPIASGFSEQWVVNGTSQTVYCQAVLANDGPALNDMVERNERFADVSQWQDVFTRLQDIYPYMNSDPFGTDQNTCYSMLANGEAGMILNGTWTITNATAMNPDVELGIFALPVSENAEDNEMAMCPASAAYAVSAETKHPEEALKFLEYMTSPEAAALYAEKGAGLPIVKGVDTSALSGAFKDAADMMNNGEVEIISSKSFPSANEDAFINDVSDFFLNKCEDIDASLNKLDTDFDNLKK